MRHAEAQFPTTAKTLPDLPALSKALTEQEVQPAYDHYPVSPPDSRHGETLAPTLGSDQELRRSDRLVRGRDPPSPAVEEWGAVAGFALDWSPPTNWADLNRPVLTHRSATETSAVTCTGPRIVARPRSTVLAG